MTNTVILTGATRGLGLYVTRSLVENGFKVSLTARNSTHLEALKAELIDRYEVAEEDILICAGDVADNRFLQDMVAKTLERFGDIYGLVSNAGIYGPLGSLESNSLDSWEYAIKVNLLGPMSLCRLLIPIFKQNGRGKIVQVSGGGATKPMANFSSYAASKAAVVRMMECLACELEGHGIDVNSVAPGLLNTALTRDVVEAGPAVVGASAYEMALQQMSDDGIGPDIDAAVSLILFLLSANSDGISGKLISAKWDNWRKFSEVRDQLIQSDAFTLRRLKASDTGLYLDLDN